MANGALLGTGQPVGSIRAPEEKAWADAVTSTGLTMTTFEGKALFATGVVRHLTEAAVHSLRGGYELPAYALLASAIEAIGRCVAGDVEDHGSPFKRLQEGLKVVLSSSGGKVTTSVDTYNEYRLVGIRHFTTHGGTTAGTHDVLDSELTRTLVRLVADYLDKYWVALQQDAGARASLSRAKIVPLFAGGTVVFVKDMHQHLVFNGGTVGSGIGG